MKNFKVNNLPTIGVPDAKYYLKVAGGTKVIEYITDNFGNYIPLTVLSSIVLDQYEEYNEILIGTIDGSNATFTTSSNFKPDKETVYVNGLKQSKPSDYNTIGNNTIIFSDSPEINDVLEINYEKLF